MKRILLFSLLLGFFPLYGQETHTLVDKPQADWRLHDLPQVWFFHHLYRDDYLGDTLRVGDKTYIFSQSPVKHFPEYMLGQTDLRLVQGYGILPKNWTYGRPDKGYVLHFTVEQDSLTSLCHGTYQGSIYPESLNGTRMPMEILENLTHTQREYKSPPSRTRLPARWLNGRYRLNDTQVDVLKPYSGNRHIAVFAQGKLVAIVPDEEKAQFNPPLVDVNERPEGTFPVHFIPTHVYYKTEGTQCRQVTVEEAARTWREKLMQTFRTEPFLDRDCVQALKNAWQK